MDSKNSMLNNGNDNESIGLSCALEMFSESNEVFQMIRNLPNLCGPSASHDAEKAYEKFKHIFNQYKEQPHLLDLHLNAILSDIVTLVRCEDSQIELKHNAFKYLFLVTNVRGYKVIVRHLPHEVSDLEPTLQLLELQDPCDTNTWETRYCLLLWLSIIIMIPFHMSRLDSGTQTKTVMERMVDICKKYLMSGDVCCNAAAYLSAHFLTRSDVKEAYLGSFMDWAVKNINKEDSQDVWKKFGILASIASILKHGKREDLLPYAPVLLQCIMATKCREDYYPLSSKYAMKIVARIGLTFLKPRVASWRYSRGKRSLALNLSMGDSDPNEIKTQGSTLSDFSKGDKGEDDIDDGIDIPPEIEEVIEELIQGLKNENSTTRWSAAKGIGRVMSRLNKQCGDEVVCLVLELLDHRYSDGAWHGGCLALAELAKRGLLLPTRLADMIPLVAKALTYDEPRGYNSVGSNVRDAACYVCWAIARAYHPSIIEPYSIQIAKALLIVVCFDREINCRRAASAAFQENVGRLGNFPHGIDILTRADYFTVGIRNNAYLKISVYIAQFEEYTESLVSHLIERKIDHWDPNIRNLTAKALFNLTPKCAEFMSTKGIQSLLAQTRSIDLNARHGSILALGEVVHALSRIDHTLIDPTTMKEIETLIRQLKDRQQLRGLSGDLLKLACCLFIDACSLAKLPFQGKSVIVEWQELIDECLCHESSDMRQAAATALGHLCSQYYTAESEVRNSIVDKYSLSLNSASQTARMGYALALGSLPAFMMHGHLPKVVRSLVKCSQITPESIKWAEARSAALKALTNICLNVGLAKTEPAESCYGLTLEMLEALLEGMKDYTSDSSRGDVGAWVREAAMLGLKDIIVLAADEASELLPPELITRTFVELAQQAVEKIDRTRGHAGRVFSSLLYKQGNPVPNIPAESKLREIFTPTVCESCNWIAERDTFPLFTQLISLPQFTQAVLIGLTGSVGGLTERLVKHSSNALFNHLRHQPLQELVRICDILATIFELHQHDDRITIPLLTFLERLLNSNCVASVIAMPDSKFAMRILRCGKTEIAKTVDSKKLTASIDFFCQLIQVPGEVCRRALVQLGILLCHRFLWLRRATAGKLYEALLVYGDESGLDPIGIEQSLALISNTEWNTLSTDIARAKRNMLCQLLNIPTPMTGPK